MPPQLPLLLGTAATIAALHTLLGPDHYLPFVAMSRALRWSRAKTVWVTLLCGLAHILSSLILALVGIALGIAASRLHQWESYRGELATWFLIAFGLVYFIWGLRRASRGRTHTHVHAHADGRVHAHLHKHDDSHVHVHDAGAGAQSGDALSLPAQERMARVTPWVLFTIFVFGPCEPLIPLTMYPASQNSFLGALLVTLVFGLVTLVTMVSAVLVLRAGVARLPTVMLERYMHALAGATLLLCGLAVRFLNL
jgi:sulfite exporter TauE/SafE